METIFISWEMGAELCLVCLEFSGIRSSWFQLFLSGIIYIHIYFFIDGSLPIMKLDISPYSIKVPVLSNLDSFWSKGHVFLQI